MSESQTEPQKKSSVNKKYMKLGIAALAALALIIGLAVGLGQRNAANRSVSSSFAMEDGYECYDEEAAPTRPEGNYGKSGKSSKSGKGSKRRRELIVPGTEDYRKVNLGLGSRSSDFVRPFGQGERRGQGLSLDPQPDSGYGKSSKSGSGSKSSKSSGGDYSSKSSKSGGGKGSKSGYCDDQCGSSKGGKSGGCGSKGSKSGSGSKGSKDEEPDYSECDTYSPTICHSKSSKGGSGKSSKSGGPGSSKGGKSGSGKSSKSGPYYPNDPSPTPPSPPPAPGFETFKPTLEGSVGSTPTVGKEAGSD